ncbi:MAG: helix-turn-helix transcriptional regulator [Salibacteraceae bacterium]
MNQLSRLISILTLLKSKRVLTATEVSERFDVSVRTVYRDIRKLEEAGVPIATIEGKGYSLMEGYTVAPVQFTEQQANALITARHMVSHSQDSSFIRDFEDALTKIKSVFKDSVLDKSEYLHQKIAVLDQSFEKLESDTLAEIQTAITNFQFIQISYLKANDFETSQRKIEPVALYSISSKWVLMAWCHLRNEYRSFRIDRIQHFQVLSQKFEDRKFDFGNYFSHNP